jgi:hypothetical protein
VSLRWVWWAPVQGSSSWICWLGQSAATLNDVDKIGERIDAVHLAVSTPSRSRQIGLARISIMRTPSARGGVEAVCPGVAALGGLPRIVSSTLWRAAIRSSGSVVIADGLV